MPMLPLLGALLLPLGTPALDDPPPTPETTSAATAKSPAPRTAPASSGSNEGSQGSASPAAGVAPSESGKEAAGEVSAEESLKALDALFAQRDSKEAVRELERRLQAALKEDPKDFEALWRLSRLRYWIGDAAPDKADKKRLGKHGWTLGDRAAAIRPERPEGHYYAAINIGTYGAGAGVWAALTEGLEGAFLKRIDSALKLDPWIDRGGPLVARGRFHYTMPWPKTDRKKARQIYQQVLERHPKNLRARYYLAQLELAEGNVARAELAIDKVRNGDAGEDPPEDRRIREWSERVVKAIAEKKR